MSQLKVPEPIWITSNQQLAALSLSLSQEAFIALDTEFVRVDTFYPQAGLLQVAASSGSYLIDPLQITDWQPFVALLLHPLVVKVFHACLEDLEVCRRLCGVMPSPIADTQLAAAFAGLGAGLSFQRLLQAVLAIHVDKDETRSNWLARPLSDKQIRYAVADVHYLYKVYPKLMQLLAEQKRQVWLDEDCSRLIQQAEKSEDPRRYFRRIKLAWKLRPQELLLLQQLTFWRETQARAQNVPRSRIMDDATLWNLARFKPQYNEKLAKFGVRSALINAHGTEILQLIHDTLAVNPNLWPASLDRPLGPQAGDRLKELKEMVNKQAEILQIPTDLLASKKVLSALMYSGYRDQHYRLPEPLTGWRRAQIGEQLLNVLANPVIEL